MIVANFIESWLQSLTKNHIRQTTIYCEKIRELFKNIPVKIKNAGKWYIYKLKTKSSTIKRPIFSKESQRKEDDIKNPLKSKWKL